MFEFVCAAPAKPATRSTSDPKTLVGVPGFIRGLKAAHAKFGLLKWSKLFHGAMSLTLTGFIVSTRIIMLLALNNLCMHIRAGR